MINRATVINKNSAEEIPIALNEFTAISTSIGKNNIDLPVVSPFMCKLNNCEVSLPFFKTSVCRDSCCYAGCASYCKVCRYGLGNSEA